MLIEATQKTSADGLGDATAHATTTRLILVRHGETAWNRIKRLQGQTDIPLSDTGVQQALLLAARLRREQGPATTSAVSLGQVHGVVSSDLSRALQTAAPLAEALGTEVMPCPGLRERHYGIFQGNDAKSIQAQWPDAHAAWTSHDPDFAPADGESLRQLYRRTVDALSAVARQYRGKTVICVAHGGVLDCAYRFTVSMPLDVPRAHPLLNASANTIDWHIANDPAQDRAQLHAWGDVAHLADLVRSRDDE